MTGEELHQLYCKIGTFVAEASGVEVPDYPTWDETHPFGRIVWSQVADQVTATVLDEHHGGAEVAVLDEQEQDALAKYIADRKAVGRKMEISTDFRGLMVDDMYMHDGGEFHLEPQGEPVVLDHEKRKGT